MRMATNHCFMQSQDSHKAGLPSFIFFDVDFDLEAKGFYPTAKHEARWHTLVLLPLVDKRLGTANPK